MATLKQTTTERIRELRKRHGWTQQDLADRLTRLGAQTDRTAVAKVETGNRELQLGEAFQYALALNVAPVHLFVPTDSDDPIQLTPDLDLGDPAAPPRRGRPQGPNRIECSPAEARRWIRGEAPMLGQDPRGYFANVPPSEFEQLHPTPGGDE